MAKLSEVTAVILEEKFRRESYVIANAKLGADDPSGQLPQRFSVLGESDPGEIKPHVPYRFWGLWDRANEYGPSFRFNSFCAVQPHGQAGVVAYLQQARHVGRVIAEMLWDEFGSDAVVTLREHPDLASEAVGRKFPLKKAEEAAADLKELQAAENITIELFNLFDGRGFGKGCVRQAIKMWGAEAVETLRRDPYKAMALRGIGFLKADKFYLDLGKSPVRLKRQAYCLTHNTLKESDKTGSVWIQVEAGVAALQQSIAGTEISPEKALTLAMRGRIVKLRTDAAGQRWVADIRRAGAEEAVARRIVAAIQEPTHWPSLDMPEFADLTAHQREQMLAALSGPVAILGGRPGTGKSFCLVRLVRALIRQNAPRLVKVMAPTGKAAQRVKELMAEAKVVGVSPMTIHRGLVVQAADDGSGWKFQHDEKNPLDCRFLIVEETSMVGTALMASLLAARPRGCHVLFVGDVNQLSPVDYGSPLRDMIDLLPYGEFREIHRNAGSIVRVCSAIVDQRAWEPDDKLDLKVKCEFCDDGEVDSGGVTPWGDSISVPCPECKGTGNGPPKNLVLLPASKSVAPQKVMEMVRNVRDKSPFDAVWDTQVLVAVNKRSPLARVELNKQLQAMLNPNPGNPKTPFRLDDKVICLRNSQLPLAVKNERVRYRVNRRTMDVDATRSGGTDWKASEEKVLVCNGEIGRVMLAEEKRTIVLFPGDPDRLVMVYRGSKQDNDDDEPAPETKGNGRPEDPKKDDERTDTGCDLDLAYAITTFKAQGSQFPIVIVCLDEYPGAVGEYGVCSREWVYTSISRAQKCCFLVGMMHTAHAMCQKQSLKRRKTFQAELIQEYAEKAGVKLRTAKNIDTINELW